MAYPAAPVYGQQPYHVHSPYGNPSPQVADSYYPPGQYYQSCPQTGYPQQLPPSGQYYQSYPQTSYPHQPPPHYSPQEQSQQYFQPVQPQNNFSPPLPPRPAPTPNNQDDMRARMAAAGVSEAQIAQILGEHPPSVPSPLHAQAPPTPAPTPQDECPSGPPLSQAMSKLSLGENPQVIESNPATDPQWPFNLPSDQAIVLEQSQSENDEYATKFTAQGADKSLPMYTMEFSSDGDREREAILFYSHQDRKPDEKKHIADARFDQEASWVRNDGEKWQWFEPLHMQMWPMTSDTGILPKGRVGYWHKVFNDKKATGYIATFYFRLFPEIPPKKMMKHKPSEQDTVVMRVDRPDFVENDCTVTIMPGFVRNREQLDECMFGAAFIDMRFIYDIRWHIVWDKKWTDDQIEKCDDLRFLPVDVVCKTKPTYKEGSAEFKAEKKNKRKENAKTALAAGKFLLSAAKLGNTIMQAEGVQI